MVVLCLETIDLKKFVSQLKTVDLRAGMCSKVKHFDVLKINNLNCIIKF